MDFRSLPALACALGLFAISTAGYGLNAPDLKLSAELGVEGRHFFQDPQYSEQGGAGVSLYLEPEIDLAVPNGGVRLVPFARWDQQDGERSHADIREFNLTQRWGDFDAIFGIGRVFWGVTESVHLVDIINQTDLVENPDGEDKLGQPMINLAWTTRDHGVFSAFVLPHFRERTLPGREGRLRAAIPFDDSQALYESSDEENHVDGAFRWSLSRGAFDLGLAHFSGTAREPRFELSIRGGAASLIPVYDLIEQSSVDLNVVAGSWLLKFEGIVQQNRVEDFVALAGGFEYTFSSVRGTAWDVGALAEFLWDDRGQNSPSAFQKDLFIGSRVAANDIAGTEFLIGAIADLESSAWFGSLEASRRVQSSGKLSLELRLIGRSDPGDPLDFFRRDDYAELSYIHYF